MLIAEPLRVVTDMCTWLIPVFLVVSALLLRFSLGCCFSDDNLAELHKAIHTSFLMFYAGKPANFGKVDSVRFENGAISIEDAAGHKMALRASLPLSDQP